MTTTANFKNGFESRVPISIPASLLCDWWIFSSDHPSLDAGKIRHDVCTMYIVQRQCMSLADSGIQATFGTVANVIDGLSKAGTTSPKGTFRISKCFHRSYSKNYLYRGDALFSSTANPLWELRINANCKLQHAMRNTKCGGHLFKWNFFQERFFNKTFFIFTRGSCQVDLKGAGGSIRSACCTRPLQAMPKRRSTPYFLFPDYGNTLLI